MPCLHHVFEGTLLCKCGKLTEPDQDAMNRFQDAFELLKPPYYRTSQMSTKGSECCPNLSQQHHHKARDASRCATKGDRAFTSIWDIDGKMIRYARNLSLPTICRTQGLDIWTTLYVSVSITLRRNRKEKARKKRMNLQKEKRARLALLIPVSERKRLHNRIDPSLQKYF